LVRHKGNEHSAAFLPDRPGAESTSHRRAPVGESARGGQRRHDQDGPVAAVLSAGGAEHAGAPQGVDAVGVVAEQLAEDVVGVPAQHRAGGVHGRWGARQPQS